MNTLQEREALSKQLKELVNQKIRQETKQEKIRQKIEKEKSKPN